MNSKQAAAALRADAARLLLDADQLERERAMQPASTGSLDRQRAVSESIAAKTAQLAALHRNADENGFQRPAPVIEKTQRALALERMVAEATETGDAVGAEVFERHLAAEIAGADGSQPPGARVPEVRASTADLGARHPTPAPKTLPEKIAAAETAGRWDEARHLKLVMLGELHANNP